jgi:hypothetical protein
MLRVQLGCDRPFNIKFYGADSQFCHSAYVTWSRVELWSVHVPARLSNFCCRTHFVRHDVRVERSSYVTSCFQKWRKCLLKKCANGTFLWHHVTRLRKSAYESQRMGRDREGVSSQDVSSRDVRIVCPRLYCLHPSVGYLITAWRVSTVMFIQQTKRTSPLPYRKNNRKWADNKDTNHVTLYIRELCPCSWLTTQIYTC